MVTGKRVPAPPTLIKKYPELGDLPIQWKTEGALYLAVSFSAGLAWDKPEIPNYDGLIFRRCVFEAPKIDANWSRDLRNVGRV